MPFVNVRTVKGLLTDDEKRELQARITEAVVAVEGKGNASFLPYVMVLVEEHDPAGWSVHGNALDAAAVRRLRDGLQDSATD